MEETMEKSRRDSKFEIARLICMFFIVINHSISHGIFEINTFTIDDISLNYVISLFCTHFGDIGNSFFMLLTGYFSAKVITKKVNFKGIAKICIVMTFYSILIMIALFLSGRYSFSLFDVVKSVFPYLFGLNWYFGCYIVIMLFQPIFSKILYSIELDRLIKLAVLVFLSKFVIPLSGIKTYMSFEHDYFQFSVMFFIGGIIYRICNEKNFRPNKCHQSWYLVIQLFFCMICLSILCTVAKVTNSQFVFENATILRKFFVNSIPINILLLINSFDYISLPRVNSIAATVPAIYLIHDNKYLRTLTWANNITYFHEWHFIFYIISICLFIFVLSIVFDFIRQKVFGCIENKLSSLVSGVLQNIDKLYSKSILRIFNKEQCK